MQSIQTQENRIAYMLDMFLYNTKYYMPTGAQMGKFIVLNLYIRR